MVCPLACHNQDALTSRQVLVFTWLKVEDSSQLMSKLISRGLAGNRVKDGKPLGIGNAVFSAVANNHQGAAGRDINILSLIAVGAVIGGECTVVARETLVRPKTTVRSASHTMTERAR